MNKNPLKSRKFWYTVVSTLGVAMILAIAGEDMAYWHGRK